MKVIVSGGGTAGHINPALAAAGRLARENNADVLFIGTQKGLESRLVPKAGFPIRYIEVSGLIRRLTLKNVLVIKQLLTAVHKAKQIMREFKPDFVIGTGGYVCAPVLLAAHALKIPTLIHEQNVIPGVTVKLTARFVDCIAISFSETTKYIKPAYAQKCVLTGNPIREEMLCADKAAARQKLGLDDRPFVVAFGGSLGAAKLNEAVIGLLNTADTSRFQFLLGTGQRFYDSVTAQLKEKNPSVSVVPYIENMDTVMTAADVVIGRAGALTVSELCALGKAAVLVPSPNVAHDHQTYNAKSMERAGGALVIPESQMTADTLQKAVLSIVTNPEKQTAMAKAAKAAGITDGTKRICDAALALMQ